MNLFITEHFYIAVFGEMGRTVGTEANFVGLAFVDDEVAALGDSYDAVGGLQAAGHLGVTVDVERGLRLSDADADIAAGVDADSFLAKGGNSGFVVVCNGR